MEDVYIHQLNKCFRTEEPFYIFNMMIRLVRQQIVQDSLCNVNRLLNNGKPV